MLRTKFYGVIENENGTLEGYASTWIRKPDSYGDVVKQGAFAKCIARLKEEGKTIPLIWSHQLDNLKSYIGQVDVLEEDNKGLHFIASFNDSADAQKVRQMYKDGVLSKFSFAYDILDEGPVVLEDGTKANELRELDIFEVSCVLVPANSDASVIDVKAGKRNSRKDEQTIRDAIALLQELLGEVEEIIESDEASTTENLAEDNAAQAKDQSEINAKKAELLDLINKINS